MSGNREDEGKGPPQAALIAYSLYFLELLGLLDLLDLLELLEFVISNYSSSRTCSFSPFSFVIVMADIVFVRVSFCKSDWSLSFISLKAA